MSRAPRRLLSWTAIPLLVAQFGCATSALPTPSSHLPVTVPEPDRKTCEKAAKAAAQAVQGRSAVVEAAKAFGEGWAFLIYGFVIAPGAAIWVGTETALDNAKSRQAAYQFALKDCLERNADQEASDVAGLHALANGQTGMPLRDPETALAP